FSDSSSKPYIKVRVFEELYLYGPRGIDRDNSGPYQGDFIYWFEKDNGTWKISDYKKVN
ncbi:MAG: IMS domain-containing protein, partial [Dolichospermum sp.]